MAEDDRGAVGGLFVGVDNPDRVASAGERRFRADPGTPRAVSRSIPMAERRSPGAVAPGGVGQEL
jgi:hypothetical protein